MAGTALDMTGPRPDASGNVYAVYGDVDPDTVTLADLLAAGTTLRRIPTSLLAALESGSPTLRDEALDHLAKHDGRQLTGAVGFDDWWNTALTALNPGFPLAWPRRLVTDKATMYDTLASTGVDVPEFITGPLNETLVQDALDRFGSSPVLKPSTGAGSRGVYRLRDTLSITDNLALYRQHLSLGHIDPTVDIIAAAYVGGDDALEISVDAVVCAGAVTVSVVHEKRTATAVEPFTDRIMVTPPIRPAIVHALPALPATITAVVATIGLADGVLHAELRLQDGRWYVLDIGVRPGSGLVAHAVQAVTGVDPRLIHLAASLGQPIGAAAVRAAEPQHTAACIACCYVTDDRRDAVTLAGEADTVAQLCATSDVFGWHLNVSAVHDEVYRPDAGLSIGVGAPTAHAAMARLLSITTPLGYTTA